MSRLRGIGRIVWTYYSALSAIFLVGLLVDLIYIWSVAFSQGATVYVNNYGEGQAEIIIFIVTIPWLIIQLGKSLSYVPPARGRRWRAAEDWKIEQAGKMKALQPGTELILQHSNQVQLEGKVVVVVSQRRRFLEVRPKDEPCRTLFIPHSDFWRVRTGPQAP